MVLGGAQQVVVAEDLERFNSQSDGPYNIGDTLVSSGTYYLYPYIAESIPRIYMGSLYSNNTVFYKPNSLAHASGGSGVRNSRAKARRT